jgi:hypothetical protein
VTALRRIYDDLHDESFIVDDSGRECCESCGAPYDYLTTPRQVHEEWCEYQPEPDLNTALDTDPDDE